MRGGEGPDDVDEGVRGLDLRHVARPLHEPELGPRDRGGEGPADLSTRYKSYLTDALEDKFPFRVSEPKPDDPRR